LRHSVDQLRGRDEPVAAWEYCYALNQTEMFCTAVQRVQPSDAHIPSNIIGTDVAGRVRQIAEDDETVYQSS